MKTMSKPKYVVIQDYNPNCYTCDTGMPSEPIFCRSLREIETLILDWRKGYTVSMVYTVTGKEIATVSYDYGNHSITGVRFSFYWGPFSYKRRTVDDGQGKLILRAIEKIW